MFEPKKSQQAPRLVNTNQSSGVELIYPQKLLTSVPIHIDGSNENLILSHQENNTFIALAPDNNNPFLFENETIINNNNNNKSIQKMDTLTRVYVASLTVIGLYIVFRVINRTR